MSQISWKQLVRNRGAQGDVEPLDVEEQEFITSVAFPQLDSTKDDKALEKLADVFWNLCLWEAQRATALDTKASAVFGLSSLAAVVITASTILAPSPSTTALLARCVSIVLFTVAVGLSLYAQRAMRYGGFFDQDVFMALGACHEPVGAVPAFTDINPYRCFLRETALQRWLVYRNYCVTNDRKARRLVPAQWTALAAVASLLITVGTALLT